MGARSATKEKLFSAFGKLTDGLRPTQHAKFKDWVNSFGLGLDSVDKGTVEKLLRRPEKLPKAVAKAMKIRRMAAKSSITKYEEIKKTMVEGWVKNCMNFYGATATGRWAGRGMQPQNFPNGGKTGGGITLNGEFIKLEQQLEDLMALTAEEFFDKYKSLSLQSLSFLLYLSNILHH